jgi:4'-phosphopantetheinyl transferase
MNALGAIDRRHSKALMQLANVSAVTDASRCPGYALAWASDGERCRRPKIVALHELEAPNVGPPGPGEIWLWLGRQMNPAAAKAWTALVPLLCADERSRLDRFRIDEDKWTYAVSHAALRSLLGQLLGDHPQDVALPVSSKGKPRLCPARYGTAPAGSLHFNISHTRGMVAVAIADRPVGVDVERVRPLRDMRQLVATLMAPEALASFDEARAPCEKIRLFFRYWTLGEAFIKATGQGLDQGLHSFAFTGRGEPRLTRVTPGWGACGRWHLGHEFGGGESEPAEHSPWKARFP